MLVNEIMRTPAAICTTNDSVTLAARIMREHKCGFVPVVDSRGAVVGAVTDRDVCLIVGDKYRIMPHVSVQEAMSRPVFSCHADENVKATLATMAKHHVRRLPVLDDYGHLQGVLSIDDVVHAPRRRGAPTADDIVDALKGISSPRAIEAVPA
jgi:CBS domain-containing protein